ncbi:alpha-L-rhamnosidase [Sphingobium sp. AP50]|uniref:glycosyl hydrolase n=1 Tax=Sphingobium sp. AP50 TaxID=1884369 RepID=UPI0008C71458|nr:glycosyl hydrolase [Sphingobium sp. AP50]SEK06250.1 alpha-L-rhamnosidase [Sphingobium sp. AP50]
MTTRIKRRALLIATTLVTFPALARENSISASGPEPTLEEQFRSPPIAARPLVWWHWMNGNITKDGIAKDLAWMKRVGIGGLQNFDANISTPQIVDKRLGYMSPEWKDAFRFAVTEADRLGLELGIAASPGWSETGGPWVTPADGMKKLTWSTTDVVASKRSDHLLNAPPSVTGPYLSAAREHAEGPMSPKQDPGKQVPTYYRDIAVLGIPIGQNNDLQPEAAASLNGPLSSFPLTDGDLGSFVNLSATVAGKPNELRYSYKSLVTVQSVTLFIAGQGNNYFGPAFAPRLESSLDGVAWNIIGKIPVGKIPSTISFAPVEARHFRVVFAKAPQSFGGMSLPPAGVDMAAFGPLLGGASGPAGLKISDWRLSSAPAVDQFEAKAGFEVRPDYHSLSAGIPDITGVDPSKIIDLTRYMTPDGKLTWTPPKGRWRILRLGYSLTGATNTPATPEATGLEVDKYDAASVRRYLEHYLGSYKSAVGDAMIGRHGVRSIITDSIEAGDSNWTPMMIDQFKRLRGYDPTSWLPALTGVIIGSRSLSDKFLYDYRRTLSDLIASEHYGTIAAVAHEHGLKVYGEALENGRPSLGDDMEMRRYADVPMAAMWTFGRREAPRPSLLGDMRGAASVAHVYGKKVVAAESLTSALAPWAFSPSDLKRVIDLEFVSGVNLPVIHTSVHQPRDDKFPGLSLFFFGQFFNRHESWAELAKPWIDYIARNAFLLQQGRNVADIAYFYGEDAPLSALYANGPLKDVPIAHAWDFINADAVAGALANAGRELVTPGGARYSAVYLGGSSRHMTLPTLRKLSELVKDGGTIIGLKPIADPSMAPDDAEFAAIVGKLWAGTEITTFGEGKVIATGDVNAALARLGVAPDFQFSGDSSKADIPFVHRRFESGDSYFLVNRSGKTQVGKARFRVAGMVPELWYPETGLTEKVSYTTENGQIVIPLTLQSDEAVHVLFRTKSRNDHANIVAATLSAGSELSGSWDLLFEKGRGAPPTKTLDKLAPLHESVEPGVRYFSGVATYQKKFRAPREWKAGEALYLDLGTVNDVVEVWVNGSLAGSAWHAPYRIDIGRAAKAGENNLEIRVANLWINRLIGDAQAGAKKVAWTSIPTYVASAPLRPSGLVGPVKLFHEIRATPPKLP